MHGPPARVMQCKSRNAQVLTTLTRFCFAPFSLFPSISKLNSIQSSNEEGRGGGLVSFSGFSLSLLALTLLDQAEYFQYLGQAFQVFDI